MKQLLKDREDEIENLKKDIKRLQRENGRMKNEVNLLNDQVARQEDRMRKQQSQLRQSENKEIDSLLSPRHRERREIIKEVEVIKEVPVIKEVQVVKEVIREVIREVPVEKNESGQTITHGKSLATYEDQSFWGSSSSILEDVVILNQKRINLTDRVEMVADLLKKYKKAGGGTPKSKRESGSVNLRDDHNRISKSHESWKSTLTEGLKGFFTGKFGKDENIKVEEIKNVVETARKEQQNCLQYVKEFYDKLHDLENTDVNATFVQIRQRKKVIDDIKSAIQGISDQYELIKLAVKNNENNQASSDSIPEEIENLLNSWIAWYNKYQNSSSCSSLTELNHSLVKTLDGVKQVKQFLQREKNIFDLPQTKGCLIPIINIENYSSYPCLFTNFINEVYKWALSVQNYYSKQIQSDNESYRQQQARDEVRTRVSTIETQINQHLEEEKEIEKMILTFHKIKILLKRLMSSIARDESKLLDYEIMMEEANFSDDIELTAEEIHEQLKTTKYKIEKTKEELRNNQDQKRQILKSLRNFALRGHLMVLTNTEIFDTQGFRNELLRGGMEDLYLVGESITDYEQIESFAKSVAKYQHKQDANKICVMKRYEIMDEQQVKFFRNELKLLRKMQHPFVGGVNGVLFTKTEAYTSIPFYSGGNLRDRFNQIKQKRSQHDYASKHEQRDFHELKRIFHEVLQALAYLHSQSITHYDIKPENIVFDEFEHPILIDFGISEDPNSTLFTQNPENLNSQIRGSVGYIAPEIKSGKPSNFTADCWSYGVMLFEAFFDDIDLESLGIIEIPMHSDDDLRNILKGLLNNEPHKRFTASQALKSDFFSQKSYDKMFEQQNQVHSDKKLEAFRHFLEVIRNNDRLLIINIHRDRLIMDLFTEFRNKTKEPDTMKFQTVVQYIGESGIDTGGLRRDLYMNFFQEICDSKYGMFTLSADGKFYYPVLNQDAQKLEEQFYLFGKILAKTLIDGDVIGDFFPICLFKFLADQSDTIDLSDVYLYDKQLYGNLQSLLMQSINGWELDWDIDENPGNFEVIDDSNKAAYILLKSRSVLIEQRKFALDAIKKGFQSLPELLSHLALLSPIELRLLLSGETYIDGDMVLHQFEFEERWDQDDCQSTRKNLCRWIRNDATSDQLKLILMLTTASPTIPVGGFNPRIKVRYVDGMFFFFPHTNTKILFLLTFLFFLLLDNSRLPEGQTCVHMLMMPNYKDDYALLAKRFTTCLENLHSSGFQLN